MNQISLHEPEFDRLDEQAVLETLRSAWVSTGGPKVSEFEAEFARYVGAKHAVSVSNGTVGLSLMLTTLARERGITGTFAVLVPNLTFIATANAVVHAGGVPTFFDTKPGSFNPGVEQIEIALLANFRTVNGTWLHKDSGIPLLAVMPAHIMGWCGEIEDIRNFCLNQGIDMLEDAAESLGSLLPNEQHLGRHGKASCFSFNGNKILTTGGGGMIVTDDDTFAKRLKHLSTTAKTDGLRFVHDEVGFNYRLVNILAALGCTQLQKLPARLARKKEIFDTYKASLNKFSQVRVYDEQLCISNNWLVNLIFETKSLREETLSALNEQGIQARPLWTPNHLQPAYKGYQQSRPSFPNSTEIWEKALSVPSSPQLSENDLSRICEIISDVIVRKRAP